MPPLPIDASSASAAMVSFLALLFLFLDCQLSGALEGSEVRPKPH
jgi:hypothetical protein